MSGVLASLLDRTVVASVPLVLAGLGEVVAERSGTIDIGIEGLLLTGCIAAAAVAALTGSAPCGLAAAIAAGALAAGAFAALTVWARVDQIVAGLGLNLIALGASGVAWGLLQGRAAPPQFARWSLPGVRDLPLVGSALGEQYGLAYATAASAIALAWTLKRTRLGLAVRALGEHPDACAAAGIAVRRWRAACLLFAGACAGAAGAYLSIMRTGGFQPGQTGGRGFVVLALVIFGRWSVGGLVAGCLFFGLIESLQQTLQSQGLTATVSYAWLEMLPYLAALAALAVLARARPGPAALGRPWPEE